MRDETRPRGETSGEMIDHGVTGFLHEPGDIQGMAESAVALLTDDEKVRACQAAKRAGADFV